MEVMRAIFACCALFSLAAFAGDSKHGGDDSCHVTAGPNDVVKRKGDVVIDAGRTIENVIALRGSVTLKKGAKVKSVIAGKGDVVLEAGAEVTETVVAIGGTVKAAKGALVGGSQLSLAEDGLSVKGETGKSVQGDLKIDGKSMSSLLLASVAQKLEGCEVEK
jgi:hypothetical protein